MSRSRLSLVAVLLLASACTDSGTEPGRTPFARGADISEARSGGNPHFFWLPPVLAAPASSQLGTFEAQASPVVKVTCWASTQIGGCPSGTPVATFTRASGIIVEPDHFKVEFDTQGYGLAVTLDATSYTTYRVSVYAGELAEYGGPFLLGYADFQVAQGGKTAKNLSTNEVIGLVDGRTLPLNFRIDRGADAYALHEAAVQPDAGADDICKENCSVTFVSPDATTTAALSEGGAVVTAMQFLPGDVAAGSVLVIDERTTADPDPTCAPGVSGEKRYCYRYLVTPDVPFVNPVRFGICPRELVTDPAPWIILKADEVAGKWTVTHPQEVDVSDFLPCTGLLGLNPFQSALRYAANWLVAPLAALGTTPTWGGMAKDLSDLYWGTGVVARVTVSPASATLGVSGTVQLSASAYDGSGNAITGQTVTWASTNPTVATVNASGLVTGIALGQATIIGSVNGVSATAQITVAVLPDLVVSGVRLGVANVLAGGAVSVTYTVNNQGGEGPAGISTFDVAMFLSTDPVLDAGDVALVTGYSAWTYHLSIGFSQTATYAATIPAGTAAGAYYIIVLADAYPGQPPNNYPGVIESVETNNWYASPTLAVGVLGQP